MGELLSIAMALSSAFLSWSLALLLVVRKKYSKTVYKKLLSTFSLLVGFYIIYFNIHHYLTELSDSIELLVSFFLLIMCFEIWRVFK